MTTTSHTTRRSAGTRRPRQSESRWLLTFGSAASAGGSLNWFITELESRPRQFRNSTKRSGAAQEKVTVGKDKTMVFTLIGGTEMKAQRCKNSINRLTSNPSFTIISDRRVTLLNAEVTMAKDTKERILMAALDMVLSKKDMRAPTYGNSRISRTGQVRHLQAL